ncbi:MAG TPA: EamA family transporter, partial [Sphingobacteriaceae bacterium]
YVIAMQEVTAGIGALAVATNPVFISLMLVFFFNKRITLPVAAGILTCLAGIICTAFPLLEGTEVSITGLTILLISMLSYSAGAVYYSSKDWNGLSLFTINGWQTLIGGLLLLPFALFFYRDTQNVFDLNFWFSVMWLAIPVSIVAIQLWLWLLKVNAVNAGLWLFLCPLFGILIAALMVNDTISIYTGAGVLLVITGLFISRAGSKNE